MLKILPLLFILCSCAGLKLKELNKVQAGMSQSKVIDLLGDPQTKKMEQGREIFQYEMKDDDGQFKPRIVVFEDREVIFYGKPSEYKKETSTSNYPGGSIHNTNTLSPKIVVTAPSITVSPTINIQPVKPDDSPALNRMPSSNGSYFHEIPSGSSGVDDDN
jgi:hypothetical protein